MVEESEVVVEVSGVVVEVDAIVELVLEDDVDDRSGTSTKMD